MAKIEDTLPDLEVAAKNQFPNLDLQDNTVEKDVFLRAPALLVDSEDSVQTYIRRTSTPSAFRSLLDDDSFINDELPAIYKVSNVSRAREILSDEVDIFAGDYDISRNEGKKSGGTVSLFFGSAAAVTITAGFGVTTRNSPSTRFVVTNSFTGSPTPSGDLWKLTLAIKAIQVGQSGNVPANNITVAESTVTGLVSVNNEVDTIGGDDIELDESVLDRVIIKFQGTSIDTVEGLRSVVLSAGAFDAAVFRIGAPETRNRPGPDILVIDETVTVQTDSFTWETSNNAGYIPEFQPVVDDVSLLSIPGHPLAQFLIVKDTSVNERSSSAQDRIIVYADIPAVGDAVNLSYGSNTAITEYQSLFEEPNDELFFDILVKTAVRKDIAISMNVVLFTGIDSSGVTPSIESALLSLINNLNIGDGLNQSDVISTVENVTGVNRVNIPLNFFGDADATGRVVENTITAGTTEYLRLATSNLTLTVL